ncbi:MAG: indolepyruvate ferredoxin oxidoreductase alpha subunit [Sulfurimonas sp.]|jgi:indolepyruvate ferredoxin oxidoreductase alpha subunit
MKQTLMGNAAIAWGLIHANVDMVSGYPGTPSSEILTQVQNIKHKLNLDIYAEWGTNEKVGFEVAYAGAIAGKRTCATMKQVGLNVASDALMSASYIGNLGGMLLIAADDPGFHSSQTEQDSRVFAKFARIPVLDPATPQDAYDLTKYGIELSEKFQIPVMLRPVMRVCHAREIIEMDEETNFTPNKGLFQRDIPRWGAVPRKDRFPQGKAQLNRIEVIKEYNWEHLLKSEFDKCEGKKTLIIAGGTGYGFAKETLNDLNLEADIVKVLMPYPLPVDEMRDRFKSYEKVLVVEEPYPCIEEQIASPNVYGKNTNSIHQIDEMSKEELLKAFQNIGLYDGQNIYASHPSLDFEVEARPPALCPGCPHRDVYYAITKVFKKKKAIYPSDIGCYTLALAQGAIDSILCMGASVSMASGFSISDPDKTVVATIGDGTFFHSGIPPLLNAIYQDHKFILVVLDNSTTAMTGRQTTPARVKKSIDIKKIVEGMGIDCMEHQYSYEMQDNIDFFKKVKEVHTTATGPTVVVVREFCILDRERAPEFIPGIFAKVDPELCVACDQCTTVYKCPPMKYNDDGVIEIDPFLCAGCGGCMDVVCPTDAFKQDFDYLKRGN